MLRAQERGMISRSEIVQRLAPLEQLRWATAQEIIRLFLEAGWQAKAAPALG